MQRKISDIRAELQGEKARGNYTPEQMRKFYRKSAWHRGVCDYAEWLFDDYLDRHELSGVDEEIVRIGKITEKDLLNGASSWEQYSRGGCALVYDEDICKALFSPKDQKRSQNGALPPNDHEDWIDVQTRVLKEAAEKVLAAVNRR